jgi:regulatory protein
MKPKTRKIPTAQSLANVALQYLGRYAASEASLRRVLENRLRRAAMQNPGFSADAELLRELRGVIGQLIEKYRKNGVLNDAAFAETQVNSLRRQGRSRRLIAQKLGLRGISRAIVASALEKNAEEFGPEEAEVAAVWALMRRRKMGPFRKIPADKDIRRKDLAALARAGFSLDIARRVLDAKTQKEEA